MGAPKQKWTAEEEASLKAGVHKYGPGKWRTILTDPEFSAVLHMRSNVDLKDKWRNINVTAIWGSRQKARLASIRKNQLTLKHDSETLPLTTAVKRDDEVVDAKPLAIDNGASNYFGPKERVKRLDSLIMEAITTMKEPSGSDRTAIASYIEEQYWAPPNLRKLLSAKLKHLLANGKLIKVKHRYRIGPNSRFSEGRKFSRTLLDGRQKDSSKAEKRETKNPTELQIDDNVTVMRSVAQEAAAAAAKAVAEAEAAIVEAEEAAREAEAAEAEAEAAQVFALAAMNAFKSSALEQ